MRGGGGRSRNRSQRRSRPFGGDCGRHPLRAGAVVVAGGARLGVFGDDLAVDVPVAPQRGQIVHLRLPDHDVSSWPVLSTFQSQYLVPWEDGRVAVGTTHDNEAEYNARTTVEGVTHLLETAQELVPDLADATFVESRVGLRPESLDGRPILGAVSEVDGAYVATGHGGGGLHRGPYSGKLVARPILGGEAEIDLAPFAPSRFE